MKIHADRVHESDIRQAAKVAQTDVTRLVPRGSRSHRFGYDVLLEGNSTRRPNSGASGAGSGYAATWDQWGWFLAELFAKDAGVKAGPYTGADDFHQKTRGQFR